MKNLLLFFIIFISWSIIIFPQFYVDKETSRCVIEFMNLVEETAKYYDAKQGLQKSFSEQELSQITKLYFKMYSEDPVGVINYIGMRKKEWDKKVVENYDGPHEPKPATKLLILKNQIVNKFGGKFTEIISTPAFIRGKVISISNQVRKADVHKPYDNLGTIVQTDLAVLIEDVLKGEKFFKKGSTITISFSSDWLSGVQYEVNKTYLFPLRPWNSLREYAGEITLNLLFYKGENIISFEGEIEEIYPIENESVYSKEDFFDTGESTSWETFKQYFKNTYMVWGD